MRRVPIGMVSIALLGTATLAGWLLGGPVGVGTLICAFGERAEKDKERDLLRSRVIKSALNGQQ